MGIRSRFIDEELNMNINAWKRSKTSYVEPTGYIEHQSRMKDIYYGRHILLFKRRRFPASYNTCEIIASYNALHDLGELGDYDFPKLIREYHKRGIFFAGIFGTKISAIKRFFTRLGFKARFLKRKEIDSYEYRAGSTFIMSFWNGRHTIFQGLHTVSVTYGTDGYAIHNNGTRKKFERLGDVISYINESDRLISVIEITMKEKDL